MFVKMGAFDNGLSKCKMGCLGQKHSTTLLNFYQLHIKCILFPCANFNLAYAIEVPNLLVSPNASLYVVSPN